MSSVVVAAVLEQSLQPAGDTGEHDVVHGATEPAPDRLHVVERYSHDRQTPVPARASVDRRARRDRIARSPSCSSTAPSRNSSLERAPRPAERAAQRTHDLRGFRQPLAQRVDAAAATELGAGSGVQLGHRRHVDSGSMSSSSVATSTPDTPSISAWCVFWMSATLPAFEALDEPQLPERPLAIEHALLHAVRERDELLPRSRARQRGVAHVVRDVEAVVVDPDRPALVVGHRASTGGGTAASTACATATRSRTSSMRNRPSCVEEGCRLRGCSRRRRASDTRAAPCARSSASSAVSRSYLLMDGS